MRRIYERGELKPGPLINQDAVAVPLRDGRLVLVTGMELLNAGCTKWEQIEQLARQFAYDAEWGRGR